VTIEFAIVLTGIVALLVMIAIAASSVLTALRCVEAAHTSARMIAIGEAEPQIESTIHKMVGSQAEIAVSRSDRWVEVTVTSAVANAPWNWEVSHTAHAYVEPAQ